MKKVCLLVTSVTLLLQTTYSACPCQLASLCNPITQDTRKEIFVFSLQNKMSTWEKFDWRKVTTVVPVGYISIDLMCLAHQYGARVVTVGNYKLSELTNPLLRSRWVKEQLATVMENYYDGINIDFEDPIEANQTDLRDAYTALVRETYLTFKQANLHYQVTVDVAWSPDCIDLRCYDSVGLSNSTDFLFVMAYDEQSQIFGDKCLALANSDYQKTVNGLMDYISLGIPSQQLVLGVPWYGYDYPCLSLTQDNECTIKRVPFRGVSCSDAAGSQIDYRDIIPLLQNYSSGGRHWDGDAGSPYFNFKDPSTGEMHQVRYDDPSSLGLKYSFAVKLDLRGVGTWNIDCLDYSDTPAAASLRKGMFDAFPVYPRYS